MNDLELITEFFLDHGFDLLSVIFSGWGVIGAFLFSVPLLRRLIKIFKNTF